jgi:hypothetical protein
MVPLHMLIISVVICIFYGVLKGLENKYINKEDELPPLKDMVRDAVIVFISSFASIFLFVQIEANIGNLLGGVGMDLGKIVGLSETATGTQAFTGEPGF